MARRQQQQKTLCSCWRGQIQLTLLLWLLTPTAEALPWDTDNSGSPGEECEVYQVDVCGVCAGDGTSCEVVSGSFSRPILSVGYHKILEIPSGAQRIKIQETLKSRNYLALRTQTGEPVINGHWAIDRAGLFYAAGTQLTYRRPNEIRSRAGESITAPGPTNQELHLYVIYQQPNPSVYYEYILPRDNHLHTHTQTYTLSDILPLVETQNIIPGHNGIESNQVPSDPVNPEPLLPYSWVATATTPCSATCGTGSRQVLFGCVERSTQTTVPGDLCGHTPRPAPQQEDCSSQPCPAFWDVGEWSECSKTCGSGFQQRQVLCRQTQGRRGNSTVTVATRLCGHTEQPETTASCQLKICSEWQIRSKWTQCSVPCGVGQRQREVLCVDNLGDVAADDECNMALRPQDLQNCDMGACARSWFYSLWSLRCSADCGAGSRSRSVVCLMSEVSSLPLDSCGDERPEEQSPCDLGPCLQSLDWYTGTWGQCSSECGSGTQSRGVVCMLNSNSQLEVAAASDCLHLPRPPDAQPCHLKSCGAQWYITDWSACSRSCEGGYRVREVRCLGDDMATSDGCDPELTPERREGCNTQTCVLEIDASCQDMYYNCVVVVQARLCVYAYYRTACCVSCSRVRHRDAFHLR